MCAAEQVPMPFGGAPQSADVQHPPTGTHVASGQGLYPSAQLAMQPVPSQAAVPFVGVGQAVHALAPQLLMLLFEAHRPLQSCVETAQKAVHVSVCAMHTPAQSF